MLQRPWQFTIEHGQDCRSPVSGMKNAFKNLHRHAPWSKNKRGQMHATLPTRGLPTTKWIIRGAQPKVPSAGTNENYDAICEYILRPKCVSDDTNIFIDAGHPQTLDV